ncbi:hypothetical protein BD410DRAFT_438459 [Rickenella mellea]|uniref:Uncharacterized protein n=1 Tax=Rickenella mellea TaxID=50990 RepID=A0A4Y7PWY7_9AGAM|nr:hypothetical protein BD410DRAFT_438459 [Rickenella mellea]
MSESGNYHFHRHITSSGSPNDITRTTIQPRQFAGSNGNDNYHCVPLRCGEWATPGTKRSSPLMSGWAPPKNLILGGCTFVNYLLLFSMSRTLVFK